MRADCPTGPCRRGGMAWKPSNIIKEEEEKQEGSTSLWSPSLLPPFLEALAPTKQKRERWFDPAISVTWILRLCQHQHCMAMSLTAMVVAKSLISTTA